MSVVKATEETSRKTMKQLDDGQQEENRKTQGRLFRPDTRSDWSSGRQLHYLNSVECSAGSVEFSYSYDVLISVAK